MKEGFIMRLVDLSQELLFIVYNPETEKYEELSLTLDEFFKCYADYKRLFIYNVDCDFLGNYADNETI